MKSVCAYVLKGKCPVEENNLNRKYHTMFQGVADKRCGAGYHWMLTYYNLSDAIQCMEHLLQLGKTLSGDTFFPVWELRRHNGSLEHVQAKLTKQCDVNRKDLIFEKPSNPADYVCSTCEPVQQHTIIFDDLLKQIEFAKRKSITRINI